jgi:hypothetical protein
MAGKSQGEKAERLESIGIERQKLIGQAIIDGILTPRDAALIDVALADADYNQGQGNYTQKGGDHRQGGGDYNQSAIIRDRFESVLDAIQSGKIIRE